MVAIRSLFLLVVVFCFFLFGQQSKSPATADTTDQTRVIWLNVIVHGVIGLDRFTPLKQFIPFMADAVHGTLYEQVIYEVRHDPFFYQAQAMAEVGFRELDINSVMQGDGATGIARTFHEMLRSAGHIESQRYFTFGWCGLFSKTARMSDAAQLHEAISAESNRLRIDGFEPRVRLIGYCHGAQLCLELATVAEKSDGEYLLVIDELLLIGMPVSPDAEDKIASPMFRSVLHIFSHGDRVQPIDIFTARRPFPGKSITVTRPETRNKLTQIELRMAQTAATHKNKIIDWNDPMHIVGNRAAWRDCSPGHIELWFFGWTAGNYRSDFSLHPLPAFMLLPHVIGYIRAHNDLFVQEKIITVDFRPEYRKLIIRQQNPTGLKHIIKDWLSSDEWARIVAVACKAKPCEKIAQTDYDKRIADARLRAEARMEYYV